MKKNMQISLLRPQQWYKNLLVFVPIIFSLNLLDIELFFLSLQGFILLCLSSSALYIFNDLIDYENSMPLTEELKYFIQHMDGSPIEIANADNAVEVVDILIKASESLMKGVSVE